MCFLLSLYPLFPRHFLFSLFSASFATWYRENSIFPSLSLPSKSKNIQNPRTEEKIILVVHPDDPFAELRFSKAPILVENLLGHPHPASVRDHSSRRSLAISSRFRSRAPSPSLLLPRGQSVMEIA